MKTTFIAHAALLFSASAVHAHPTSSEDTNTFVPRQNGNVVTAGATGGTQTRLEIRQLFSKQPDHQSTSYYQIAGIHGLPRQDYDGVEECDNCYGANGYCTHSIVLFPAWHRAYLALYEQEFLKIVTTVAASYPTSSRARMKKAASTMRIPYFDWAAQPPSGGNAIPDIITNSTLTVNSPTGRKSVANPLYQYKLQTTSGLGSPYSSWPDTLRYPTSNNNGATSRENTLINAFANQQSNLQDRVYSMFSTCNDYYYFSNDNAGSSSTQCSTSLESIHDSVHTLVGGFSSNNVHGGHMAFLSVAAFDPIFWLHHANVDRLFALWQTVYPSSYGAGQYAAVGTWTYEQNSYQDADSPLSPFYKDSNGNFWSTNDVQDWSSTFQHTYPEYADSAGDRNAIIGYVNALYSPQATANAGSSKRAVDAKLSANESGLVHQYTANVHAPRFALGGSYTIHMFIGKPESEDPITWVHDANNVGMVGVFSMPDMHHNTLMVADTVPLTRALNTKLTDLSTQHVATYLHKNLYWRIAGPDGNSVDPRSVPGFSVGVFSATSTPASEFEMPVWSPFVGMPEITQGRNGGAGRNSTIWHPEQMS